MICKIAGLGVDVPPVGDMPERCEPYLSDVLPVIRIDPEKLKPDRTPALSAADNYYLDSGYQFYIALQEYDGLMLHASCVVTDGYAYLFSGPCGIGKSTHTQKYLKRFPQAVILNDDKPALRRVNGRWYAYGTPWCGKDGINENIAAPVAGICFLHRGDRQLNRLSPPEAAAYILLQTIRRTTPEQAGKLMRLIGRLVTEIPVFEFYNHADAGDEMISFTAMHPQKRTMNNETEP